MSQGAGPRGLSDLRGGGAYVRGRGRANVGVTNQWFEGRVSQGRGGTFHDWANGGEFKGSGRGYRG